jgi:hypothetical protein
MRGRKRTFGSLMVTAALAVGCSGGEPSPAPSATRDEGTAAHPHAGSEATTNGEAAANGETTRGDEGSQATRVVCHLSCSGTETSASGATEEEARAAVTRHVRQSCRPEDGQYFVFCDPPR